MRPSLGRVRSLHASGHHKISIAALTGLQFYLGMIKILNNDRIPPCTCLTPYVSPELDPVSI